MLRFGNACGLCLSLVMGTIYLLYFVGVMGTLHQKDHLTCISNDVDYHPYPWAADNNQNAQAVLQTPGFINVSARFSSVILFGLVSNAIIIGYCLIKMASSKNTEERYAITFTALTLFINLMWIV